MSGIYLHVPFCHVKCSYCDFYSVANTSRTEAYVQAVREEFAVRKHELGGEALCTLYFGGGTPSMLSFEHFRDLAQLLYSDGVEEFTVEANPEDVTPERVAMWVSCGVNRVSLGVQSLVDEELKAVGRRHSADDALRAIATIKAGGIHNISGDLIYGLPHQTEETWIYSLESLLASGITHLSAYCLSYEEGTRLYLQRQRGQLTEASEELIAKMYAILCDVSKAHGFEHYEISNFALHGYRSAHNSSYWDGRTPYLGLGPGAHSLDWQGVRRYVPSSLRLYTDDSTREAVAEDETELDRANDTLITALRTADGLDLHRIPPRYHSKLMHNAQKWIKSGVLLQRGEKLTIPEEHWLVSDACLRDLMLE